MLALTRFRTLTHAYRYLVEDLLPDAQREPALAAIPTLTLDEGRNWARANAELGELTAERLEMACCGERGAVLLSPKTEAVLDALAARVLPLSV